MRASIQKIHHNSLCSRFPLVSQSRNPSGQFSFLKTTPYLFSSLIWPKVEPPDLLGVIKWLEKKEGSVLMQNVCRPESFCHQALSTSPLGRPRSRKGTNRTARNTGCRSPAGWLGSEDYYSRAFRSLQRMFSGHHRYVLRNGNSRGEVQRKLQRPTEGPRCVDYVLCNVRTHAYTIPFV